MRTDARGPTPARPDPAAEPCAPAPGVRLVQLDEHTQAFEFTCACGQVSLIEIQYEAKP